MLNTLTVKEISPNTPCYIQKLVTENLGTSWLFVTPLQDVNGNYFYYTQKEADGRYKVTGNGEYVYNDWYGYHCREKTFSEWYGNVTIQHLMDTAYVMLNTFPEYDRDYCQSFMVSKDWLETVMEDGETVDDYLERADWAENYQIFLHADSVGAILFAEMTDTYANMLDMLGRLRSDCLYFLGFGNRNPDVLWAHDVKKQIAKMKELWIALPQYHKPAWLTWNAIESFEKRMLAK